MKYVTRLALISLVPAAFALAAPMSYPLPAETAKLRPSAHQGRQAAEANCQVCHSVDYIEIQPPAKGKAFWEAEVTKMVNVYKAQISADDHKAIVDYLAETY